MREKTGDSERHLIPLIKFVILYLIVANARRNPFLSSHRTHLTRFRSFLIFPSGSPGGLISVSEEECLEYIFCLFLQQRLLLQTEQQFRWDLFYVMHRAQTTERIPKNTNKTISHNQNLKRSLSTAQLMNHWQKHNTKLYGTKESK